MLYIMIGIEILGLLTNFWASYTSIRAKKKSGEILMPISCSMKCLFENLIGR